MKCDSPTPASPANEDARPAAGDASLWPTVYLAVGANLGERRTTMRRAIEWLTAQPAISLEPTRDIAPLYESAPVDCLGDQPAYLNTVVRLRTTLSPGALLELTQEIECSLGRRRRVKNEARAIDIDLLVYDSVVHHDTELTLPHPRLADRRFVLDPFADLAPGLLLPTATTTVAEAADQARSRLSDQRIQRVAASDWATTRA